MASCLSPRRLNQRGLRSTFQHPARESDSSGAGCRVECDHMQREHSIQLVMAKADQELDRIRNQYPIAIQARATDADLEITVNDCLHHRRQALDFLAHEIVDRYIVHRPKKIYFPLADRKDTRKNFEIKLKKWFPNLSSAKHKLFDFLLSIQEFRPDSWLHDFQKISNTNKHDHLVAHEFKVSVVIGEGAITMPPGGTLVIPAGNTLEILSVAGNFFVHGPRTITGSDPPAELTARGIRAATCEWFDFRIGQGTIGVLDMVERAKTFTENAYANVKALL